MKSILLLIVLANVVLGQTQVTVGHCMMRGTSNDPGITGTVTFTQSVGSSLITMDVDISGITQNINVNHGMHVHEFGDLSSATATSAGSHWNPTGATHGCEYNTTRHYGDTGNWLVTQQGTISGSKVLDLLALTGNTSIIGLAVVLHNTTDDCSGTTSAGSRLAYCVIGVANPTYYNNATSNSAVNGNTGSYQRAICMLTNTVNSNITGWILFSQTSPTSPTTVQAVFYNMTGVHGFHIHQFGDLRLNNGLSTGSHWNPLAKTHGIPPFPVRHSGDMGNIYYYDTGVAYYAYVNDAFTIPQILGLAAIVHANQDDCTAPVGNAGSRLSYCVIGVANPATNFTFPGNVPTDQNDTACQTLYATTGGIVSQATTGSAVTQATTGGSGSGVATTGGSGSGVATTGGSGSGAATTGSSGATGATGGATSTTDADSDSSDAYRMVISMLIVALAFLF